MKRSFSDLINVSKNSRNLDHRTAFTIVELLVVIVVIGILAAVTIVSYTGITNRANIAALQTDLANASKLIKLFYVDNAVYPGSVTDCPTPVAGNMCLKSSGGNTYSSYSANNVTNPPTFSLSATNSGRIYKVTNDTQPVALGPSPLTPVADWLATMQGDHYGNFYDLVTKRYASVTRSSAKTVYDQATNKIYDVPANYLAINPRSDGKSGSEAVIEEGRTNYLLHSYFDNNLTGWPNWGSPPTREVVATGGVYSNNALHLVTNASNQGVTQVFNTNIGTTYTASVYVKVISGQARMMIYNNGAFTGPWTSLGWAGDGKWHQLTSTFTEGATSDDIWLGKDGGGVTGEYYFSAVQIEVGAFATSYIPTTTSSVARNSDAVTVPSNNWSINTGTTVAVAGLPAMVTNDSYIWEWRQDDSNRIGMHLIGGTYANANFRVRVAAVDNDTPWATRNSAYSVPAVSWLAGSKPAIYTDGANKAISTNNFSTFASPVATVNVGQVNTGSPASLFNGPIQRLTVFSSALSDSDIVTVTNAIKDGP